MIQHNSGIEPIETQQLIGRVTHVLASEVRVALVEREKPGGIEDFERQQVNVGRFVAVSCLEFSLIGRVSQIRSTPTVVLDKGQSNSIKQSSSTAIVELLCTLDPVSERVVQGLVCNPKVGDPVFIAPANFIQMMVGVRGATYHGESALSLSFAKIARGEHAPLSFTPEMLFGRHCAILGATGGGKSWSVARLVEQTARFRSKIILFDPSGEFSSLERFTRHVYLGEDREADPRWQEVTLPYYQLTEGDLFAIFRPTGHSQGPKLRAAIQSLKLAMLAPELAPDGTIIKAHKYKAHYESQYMKHIREIEEPSARFDISKLARQIENECVNPYRSATEPGIWGDSNRADYASCVPLLNRISDVISSPNLACIFRTSGNNSLLSEIDDFLNNESERVLRISLQHVPFQHHAREIIANALGRHLTDLARAGRFRSMPVVVILDEAHHFLNRPLEESAHPLDAFANIAKEGRKYCLTIGIATQRPRDIPDGVLSQMGTLIIHRLINDQDRSVVERACGELDHSSLQAIPTLAPGEAVLLGVDFPTPIIVKVERPEFEPHSHGPNYQRYWR